MSHSLSQRLVTLLLLMAYTITGTSTLPATLAFVAAIDDSHQVIIGQSPEGVVLTLHHRPGEYTPCVADHRHMAARMLVCLCSSSRQGDHQMNSARLSGDIQKEGARICRIRSGDALLDSPATRQWSMRLRLLQAIAVQLAEHRLERSDVPGPADGIEIVRSVQMLI